jgi:cholesterol transport system auxiliary component
MLHPLLISSLEHTGSWGAVATASGALRADYRLEVSGLVLVQEFDSTSSHLRLSWRAQVIRLHDGQPVGVRRFETVQAATSDDAYGGVRAANQALATLLGDMSAWVRTCVTNHQKAPC